MNRVKTKLDHDLIEAVRQHPEIYHQQNVENSSTWSSIAKQINRDSKKCRSEWLDIQNSYAFIKGIINDRWELESVLQVYPETSMYLDGSLNFLDPYVNTTNKIPRYIQNRYKWINSYLKVYSNRLTDKDNNLTLVTQQSVQAALSKRTKENHLDSPNMKYLMEVVGATITQCITRFNNNKVNSQVTDIARKNLVPEEDFNRRSLPLNSKIADPLNNVAVDHCIENMSINVGENAVFGSIAGDERTKKEERNKEDTFISVQTHKPKQSDDILTNVMVTMPSESINTRSEDNLPNVMATVPSYSIATGGKDILLNTMVTIPSYSVVSGSEDIEDILPNTIVTIPSNSVVSGGEDSLSNVMATVPSESFSTGGDDILPTVMVTVPSYSIATVDDDILPNVMETVPSDDFEMKEEESDSADVTEVNSENGYGRNMETDLKSFFSDLVDFVSDNFTLQKQKELQRRVTQLVSELYAENDPE